MKDNNDEQLSPEGAVRYAKDDPTEEDTEGHRLYAMANEESRDDDTEGNGRRAPVDDEDTEGHGRRAAADDEDVEGHALRR